jgi:23S rRNA G2069 N7-methylase RlmK/C1962 C5-methylase RlmI
MTILYQDKKWLVVNKPSGISTHRAHEGDLGLVEWLDLHHDLQVQICSRLDKGTSGVLLFALTPEAVAEAQTVHEEERAQKSYFFIAKKSPRTSWVCSNPLDNKPCTTHFSKIREGRVHALYKAVIHRGRTHQIRRHAAASGIPLLGDREYGGKDFARLSLHCTTVEWPGIDHALHAPLPQWFESCLDGILKEAGYLALVEKRYPFLSDITDCCRLLQRGEYSDDMAVDKYGQWLCVTGFNETLPAQQLLVTLEEMLTSLCRLCGCRGGIVKTNLRDPHKNKLFADIAAWGEAIPESFLVREHDLHFSVQLNDRQHVGLFLDQRDSRSRIARIARGKRMANLFAFTCSFSIYALAARAEVVFSVDLAAGCLRQGQENVDINQLAPSGNAKFIREDTRKWLARQLRKKQNNPGKFIPFDVVICDPPVFAAASKGKSFHVEKEWPGLARDVHEILASDGMALFANNHQAGTESFYFNVLNKLFSHVTRMNPPLDFPQVAGHPSHVSIYWCQK